MIGDGRDDQRNHIGQRVLDPHLDESFESNKSEDVKSENNGDDEDVERPVKQCPLCNKKIKSGGNHSTAQEAVSTTFNRNSFP